MRLDTGTFSGVQLDIVTACLVTKPGAQTRRNKKRLSNMNLNQILFHVSQRKHVLVVRKFIWSLFAQRKFISSLLQTRFIRYLWKETRNCSTKGNLCARPLSQAVLSFFLSTDAIVPGIETKKPPIKTNLTFIPAEYLVHVQTAPRDKDENNIFFVCKTKSKLSKMGEPVIHKCQKRPLWMGWWRKVQQTT